MEGDRTMSFEELLLKAIDEELSSLGDACKQAIYFYLEKKFNLNKQDIPFRIADFTGAIENIFGMGAKVLEIRIMKNLFENMGYPLQYYPNRECLEFTKYIESARVNKNRLNCLKALKQMTVV